MAAITEISPERKRNARLFALVYVLSWAFVFFTILGLTIPAQAMEKLSPAPIWFTLLVLLVVGLLMVLAIGDTISRMDEDHHGRRGLAGWIAAGLMGGLFSGLSNLPFILNNEAGWASLARNFFWFVGPLVGYGLAFRRNPFTAFANLPPVETPGWVNRIVGGIFLFTGIVSLIIALWIVNGLLTQPGFRAPWGMVAALPISLSAIAFGWTFAHYTKPYDREAIIFASLGVLMGITGAGIAVAWLIWG